MKGAYAVGLGLFAVVAAFFIYANKGFFAAELNAYKLLPQPEPFTELYLNNFVDLQKSLPPSISKGTTISFSFVIHNLEGRNISYPYTVYIVSAGATTTVASGSVKLADTASTIIISSYTFKHATPSATVYVSLPQQNQSLHFFIPNKK